MKKIMVTLFVFALLTSGCSMLGDSAKITVRNKPTTNVKMTDVVEELQENYGEAAVKIRAYKLADGTTQVVKDLYFETGRGDVVVTVINDEVTQIITTDTIKSID